MSIRIVRADDVGYYKRQYKAIFVDVRSRDEYAKGHIPEAIHLSSQEIDCFMKKRGMDKLTIFYCERGITSAGIAKNLSQKGYTVGTLAGGFTSYRKFR